MKRAVISGGARIEYDLYRTGRSNVMLRVLPMGETRVYAPTAAHLRDIDRFVGDHAAEILRMQRELDANIAKYHQNHPIGDGVCLCIEGRPLPIRIQTAARCQCRVTDSEIVLYLTDPADDAAARAAIRSALSRRALARIREQLDFYAPRIGVYYGRIAIRDQRSRWGSCSAKGNLNFNWKLIMAPPEALCYVVIHELCHLIEFNHSPRFWARVQAQMPDYEAWKKWLKNHGGELGI